MTPTPASLVHQGARICWERSGDGPPVLLGHSLLCDGRMWGHVAPDLARRHRVLNVEARGHGRSGVGGPFSLDDLGGDWLAILDREGIDRAVLVGLSMGGMTAMRLALRAPERVAGLALLDTSADPEPWKARLKYRVMAEIVRHVGLPRRFVETVSRAFFGATTRRERPDLVAAEAERLLARDTRPLYHATRAVFDRGGVLHRLGAIACPTLVLVGAEDAATPPSRARRIAAAIPGARLAEVPRAGHLTPLEAPTAVLEALTAFLALLPSAGDRWLPAEGPAEDS